MRIKKSGPPGAYPGKHGRKRKLKTLKIRRK